MTKKLIFILLVLAVALVAMPAMATAPFYESKYAPAAIETPAMSGMIYIGTACNTNLFSKEFTITRVTNPQNIQFTNGAVVTKEYADLFPAVNASPFVGELYGTGYWSTTDWAPGIFVVKLLDGNAGDPEYAVFETVPGQTTTIMFQGHAAVIPVETPEPGCSPVYTIENAMYGEVEERCHEETVVDVEPWVETIVDIPAWDEQIPAVTHIVHHAATMATGQPCGYFTPGHVHAKKNSGHTDFTYNGNNYHITGDWDDNTYLVTPGTPAWDETIVDVNSYIEHHEAVTRTVEHPAETHGVEVCENHGTIIEVTKEVQYVVYGGNLQFIFDNRPSEGGIFSTIGTLLEQIDDPAVGIVKGVTITYSNGCGIDKTIETGEYCTINLVDGSTSCPSTETEQPANT